MSSSFTISSFRYYHQSPLLKQTRNNFEGEWSGGGGLRSLYFNYTPAPLRASFSIDYICGQILMPKLNFIKGKFLDIIASYTSTGRWSSLFMKTLGGLGQGFFIKCVLICPFINLLNIQPMTLRSYSKPGFLMKTQWYSGHWLWILVTLPSRRDHNWSGSPTSTPLHPLCFPTLCTY